MLKSLADLVARMGAPLAGMTTVILALFSFILSLGILMVIVRLIVPGV